MNQDRNFNQNDAPVKVGDELDVKIEAVGKKGDGIVKKDGFVLFVPNTKEGQEVKIRITKVLANVGFAEVAGESEGSADAQEETASDSQAKSQEPEAVEPEEKVEDTEDFGEEEEKKE